jgi:hypothetical protein
MHLITETSDLQENPTTGSLQAAIDLWLADLDSLYQEWMALQPEQAERIGDVQAAFMDYYQANLALWNAQFGSSPSPEALQRRVPCWPITRWQCAARWTNAMHRR